MSDKAIELLREIALIYDKNKSAVEAWEAYDQYNAVADKIKTYLDDTVDFAENEMLMMDEEAAKYDPDEVE